MKISILGYMGSGKSTIGKDLAFQLGLDFIDLDAFIETKESKSIIELFSSLGEIKFRKIEHEALSEILNSKKNIILAVGGGTPVYYNNMEIINNESTSIYLRLTPNELSNRLQKEKEKRPLISHIKNEDLPEFVAKHLFERRNFYEQADIVIDVRDKSTTALVQEIIPHLPLHGK